MTTILLGVSRARVTDKGHFLLQNSSDVFELDVPEDGSEFLARVWMMADGLEVLNLPLTMMLVLTLVYQAQMAIEGALCSMCDSRLATRPDGLCAQCGKLKDDLAKTPPKPSKPPKK